MVTLGRPAVLLQRFRAVDRRTTVTAAGAVAFAYREMADHVVESPKQQHAPAAAKAKTNAASEDLAAPADLHPGTEEQVTRLTDVPALSAAQFRQVFLTMSARLREHPLNRTELSRLVRDDCVSAGQPASRNAVNFVPQGLAYANFQINGEATAADLAAAWTANVKEFCRVALLEYDAAEKSAVRRWASGGLLENTQAGISTA